MAEWFENERFWDEFAPVMFDEPRWAEAEPVADAIESLVAPQRSTAVLDMCCGPGRIAVELGRRGHTVTGVDITPTYLEAAKAWAETNDTVIELIEADARTWVRQERFDLALNLYTSIGYCADRADDLAILRNLHGSLKPGGVAVVEIRGKEIAVRDFTEGEWYERGGGIVLTDFSVSGAWDGLRSHWIFLKNGKRHEHEFVQRLYAGTELASMLESAGFASVTLHGGWDFRPYGRDADTLIAVGRKANA